MTSIASPCRRQAVLAALAVLATWASLAAPANAREPDPAVPPGLDPGGVAVAQIDTGVNYTLPHIASRLARDGEGVIIGYDFHDDDQTPFDAVPGDTRERPRGHGTSVASVFLREAPTARLQPYRFHAGDPASFAAIVEQIAYTQARIAMMPLGGYREADWTPFAEIARQTGNILFIVSAGNEAKDLDKEPLYPAAFKLPNVLVVAATDAFGRFPISSNWSANLVDISTPAEQLTSIGTTGARVQVSGSSYAVPRIAALAARILKARPGLSTAGLKAAIITFAGPNPARRTKRTRHGWIAAPNEVAAGAD